MNPKRVAKNFPVVCVGGSAGGLDAYTRLLRHLQADLGVAMTIVNHVRHVATRLHEILPRFAAMSVELITERVDTGIGPQSRAITKSLPQVCRNFTSGGYHHRMILAG